MYAIMAIDRSYQIFQKQSDRGKPNLEVTVPEIKKWQEKMRETTCPIHPKLLMLEFKFEIVPELEKLHRTDINEEIS